MREMLLAHYEYSSWATTNLLNVIEQLTPEQFNQPGCSGNGSIRETLVHMINAQKGWFAWLDGSLPLQQARASRLQGADVETFENIKRNWEIIDKRNLEFIRSLSEEDLQQEKKLGWGNNEFDMPLWKLLFHISNHNTHTRAQIMSAIRRMDISPGNNDLILYFMQQK